MEKILKIVLYIIIVIGACGIVLKITDERNILELNKSAAELSIRQKVRTAGGGTSVLKACRRIADEFMVSEEEGVRILEESDWLKLPENIRIMRASAICVERDEVMLLFETPGFRTALLAFKDGADQYGTSLITNGLWYWTFEPSRDTYDVYERKLSLLERKRERMNRGRSWLRSLTLDKQD